MTSNATREQLRQTMRPEFLNRIDEIITFTPLTKEQIADVVRLQMKKVTEMLAPQGITLECTPQAIAFLAEEGYDPESNSSCSTTCRRSFWLMRWIAPNRSSSMSLAKD